VAKVTGSFRFALPETLPAADKRVRWHRHHDASSQGARQRRQIELTPQECDAHGATVTRRNRMLHCGAWNIRRFVKRSDDNNSALAVADDHNYEFPLRQEHIADATGLTFAHVNRVLSEMRKKELIELKPR
jgi:CRP-like cAMP-binding protein